MSELTTELTESILDDKMFATDPAREALEDILEERDKGPFVPVPDDLVERVMSRVMTRVRDMKAHV